MRCCIDCSGCAWNAGEGACSAGCVFDDNRGSDQNAQFVRCFRIVLDINHVEVCLSGAVMFNSF
jgi:hypothetical protein